MRFVVLQQFFVISGNFVKIYLFANTDNFTSNIDEAKNLLSTVKDKTITVTSVFKSVYQNDKSAFGFGDGYATGTDYATPGAHWVGENGPELLWFNGGEKVLDAKKSAALMREYSQAVKSQGFGSEIQQPNNFENVSLIRQYSEIAKAQTSVASYSVTSEPINYTEPISAKQSSGTAEYKIEIKNEFTIEGNATNETIAALDEWGKKFREIVHDEFAEILENNRRSEYI